jgi:hypothetical protein
VLPTASEFFAPEMRLLRTVSLGRVTVPDGRLPMLDALAAELGSFFLALELAPSV